MATIISAGVADSEMLLTLATFIHKRLQKVSDDPRKVLFADSFAQLLESDGEDRFVEMWQMLVEKLGLLVASPDAEACFQVMFLLLRNLDRRLGASVQTLVTQLVSVRDRPGVRYRVLSNLYSTLVEGSIGQLGLSVRVLLKTMEYALNTKQQRVCAQLCLEVEPSLRRRWEQHTEDILLYVGFYDLGRKLLAGEAPLDDTQRFTVMYLTCCECMGEEELKKRIPDAEAAIMNILRDSNMKLDPIFVDRLLRLKIVEMLDRSPSHSIHYQLLRIIAQGDYEEYLAFEKGNEAGISSLELKTDDLRVRMRLNTLISLSRSCSELPFDKIVKGLQVSEMEVEEWIIRGIRANLVGGKIDQCTRTFYVARVAERGYGKVQWESVHARLVAFKKQFGDVLSVLES